MALKKIKHKFICLFYTPDYEFHKAIKLDKSSLNKRIRYLTGSYFLLETKILEIADGIYVLPFKLGNPIPLSFHEMQQSKEDADALRRLMQKEVVRVMFPPPDSIWKWIAIFSLVGVFIALFAIIILIGSGHMIVKG